MSSEPGGASLADRLAAEYVQLVFAASADDKVVRCLMSFGCDKPSGLCVTLCAHAYSFSGCELPGVGMCALKLVFRLVLSCVPSRHEETSCIKQHHKCVTAQSGVCMKYLTRSGPVRQQMIMCNKVVSTTGGRLRHMSIRPAIVGVAEITCHC